MELTYNTLKEKTSSKGERGDESGGSDGGGSGGGRGEEKVIRGRGDVKRLVFGDDEGKQCKTFTE